MPDKIPVEAEYVDCSVFSLLVLGFLISFAEFADCCGFEDCAELSELDCSVDCTGATFFFCSACSGFFVDSADSLCLAVSVVAACSACSEVLLLFASFIVLLDCSSSVGSVGFVLSEPLAKGRPPPH